MGYHIAKIKKGVLGESSKIQEELDELVDAEIQGAKIMALCELSDIIGAVRAYLEKNHAGSTLEDLIHMSKLTESAFKDGSRKRS